MDTPDNSGERTFLIGRRIIIWGHSGSGKSALAETISRARDLPLIELDAMFWRPNWEESPRDEFAAAVAQRVEDSGEGWVVAGNYGKVRELLVPQADTIIWLRLPFRIVFWRLFWRTIRRARTKEHLWGTNYETYRKAFLRRDSILLWGITNWKTHVRNTDRVLEEIPHTATIHRLSSAKDVDALVGHVLAERGNPANDVG